MFSSAKTSGAIAGRDLGLLTVRVTVGGLMVGHGAQKLFGSFGGPGLEGTTGWLESLGLRPGKQWAMAAGGSEFGGGLLTALGLLHPLGPIAMMGSMAVATRKAHWGKPIWVSSGGAELPLTNVAIGVALCLVDPGRLSLDRALGIHVPWQLSVLAAGAVALGVVFSETTPALGAPAQESAGPDHPQDAAGTAPELPANDVT